MTAISLYMPFSNLDGASLQGGIQYSRPKWTCRPFVLLPLGWTKMCYLSALQTNILHERPQFMPLTSVQRTETLLSSFPLEPIQGGPALQLIDLDVRKGIAASTCLLRIHHPIDWRELWATFSSTYTNRQSL